MRNYLLLILALGIHIEFHSQVTIGASQAPAKGALLELTQGVVTTKGMMLPRVVLSAINELKMGENALPTNEYLSHRGLMVYNIADVENCPTSTSISKGIYVWDGLQWNSLTNTLHEGVTAYFDQDGNKFLAREFGAAGIWMTENLRAKTYDLKRDSVDPNNENMTGPKYNDESNFNSMYWAYPAIENSTDPTDSSLFDANPSLGLLYTWAAASRGQGVLYHDEGGEGHPEYPLIIRQGICPSGWHLPTDKEWTLLENEIQSQTSKYSSMADIGGTGTVGETSTAKLLSPLTDPCEPYPNWPVGTSNSKEKGGFANLYAGRVEGPEPTAVGYGQSSYHWTGSMNHYMVHIRLLDPELWGSENIERMATGGLLMLSVRCKKN